MNSLQHSTGEEQWRPVVGYEGWYEVSDRGRVRGLARSLNDGRRWKERILVPSPDKDGYPKIRLCKNGTELTRGIHILVAAAFLGPCPQGLEVNHIDTNKRNPAVDNLEYVTSLRNKRHALEFGLMPFGERQGHSKLTEAKVAQIRKLLLAFTKTELSRKFGVSPRTIYDIAIRRTWRHVS